MGLAESTWDCRRAIWKVARTRLRQLAVNCTKRRDCISENWRLIGSYCVDGNRSQARAHILVAQDCRSAEARPSDDLEEQIGEWLTPQQWGEYLATGKVATLGAAMAVYAGILAISK